MSQKPQDFIEKSNLRGVSVLFADWAALFATIGISIWLDNLFVYLISIWVIGSLQFSIGEALSHEASHYTLFKTKKLNDYLEFLYGLPFFVDMSQYRHFHSTHHIKMNTDEDHTVEDYEIHGLNKPEKNMFWLWFIKPITGYAGLFYLKYVIELNPRKSAMKFLSFWAPIILVCWYFEALHILFFYWFIPFLWSFSSFYYWSEIGEHFNSKSGTRTDLGILKNFFHHNVGYHHIHHKYPSIPWYKLPEAHKALFSEKSDVCNGFFDMYRQMKNQKQ